MLARWLLDVSFQVTVFKKLWLSERGRSFWCPKLSFGRPGGSIFAPWGTTLAPWGSLGQQKGHHGIQSLIFIDFRSISGPHFASFSGTLEQHWCFFLMFFSVFFLWFSGKNLVVWSLENKDLVWEGVQKPTCHRCRDSVDFRVDFSCFLVALGSVFMTFGALEISLKSDDFSWFRWGGSGLRQYTHWTH